MAAHVHTHGSPSRSDDDVSGASGVVLAQLEIAFLGEGDDQ